MRQSRSFRMHFNMGGWVEEHVMRLINEGSNRQDFIDVMFLVIEGTSMFSHSKETVIKGTVKVNFAFLFIGRVCFFATNFKSKIIFTKKILYK